jgi:hypothetical protein
MRERRGAREEREKRGKRGEREEVRERRERREAREERPDAQASRTTIPNGSLREGMHTQSALLKSWTNGKPLIEPRNRTADCTPSSCTRRSEAQFLFFRKYRWVSIERHR